ncbi:unnamed protein product [Debaryomyces tyrocola]|nr:unnamed protein product [Debaryomyces tyrocola]
MTSWPSWLRRETVNLKIVSSTLTEVVIFFFLSSMVPKTFIPTRYYEDIM